MPSIEWFTSMLTTAEWFALLKLGLVIYSGTELVKRVHRKVTKRYGDVDVWFYSLVIGFAGAWIIWPNDSKTYWYTIGVISGPLSSWVHLNAIRFIGWKWPGLAVALTGNRRKDDIGPPDGKEKRK